MPYIRKCENWLQTFHDWSLIRSEAPESYHLWTGLFTLASCLKRRVRIPKKILGGWEVSPSLYVMFIAPPGKARKSTTSTYSEDLLQYVEVVERCSTQVTKEKLIEKLGTSRDASLSIFSSEFSNFIQKSGPDMYDVLTLLFDANRQISAETLSRKMDFAEKPCVNLLACTTPGWVAANMPEDVIGGGFASRVIFVVEEASRRKKLLYKDGELDWTLLESQRETLVEDLRHIAINIEGDFEFDEEAWEATEAWYHKSEETAANYRLQGYYERRPAHLMKLMMLIHISYSDELVLNKIDFETALTILEDLERKLPKAFEHIGKNPYTSDMMKIVEFIERKGKVTYKELAANFYQVADPRTFESLVEGLVSIGKLAKFSNEDDPMSRSKTIYKARA